MDLHLVERTAVVTGGGGAICGAIARGLAAEGAAVAIWDLDAGAGEASAAEIRAAGGSAISVPCDATDRRERRGGSCPDDRALRHGRHPGGRRRWGPPGGNDRARRRVQRHPR